MTSISIMKNTAILLAVMLALLIIIGGCTSNHGKNGTEPETPKNDATTTLNQYYSSIDYSCKASADCEIKDITNCCGNYPQCVNKNAKTDPELVRILCAKEGAASICGFPSIISCECLNSRCEGST